MKLIPEQIKYLREREKELSERREKYLKYCTNRDGVCIDNVGMPHFADYQADAEYYRDYNELKTIRSVLNSGEFLVDRDFDKIDIGTAFTVRFDDTDELDRVLLVDSSNLGFSINFVSVDSDFGNAVFGKEPGDNVSYVVKATGRTISLKIEDIDKIHEHYEHFIKEKPIASRISSSEKRKLSQLKKNNINEYEKRHMLSDSQISLVKEELNKLDRDLDNSSSTKRRFLMDVLEKNKRAKSPNDDSIGIGSVVTVLLTDSNGNVFEKTFEMINQAVSTELESHYVERISPLGKVIYGLKPNDTFRVLQKHKPSLKGIVVSVDNHLEDDYCMKKNKK